MIREVYSSILHDVKVLEDVELYNDYISDSLGVLINEIYDDLRYMELHDDDL